METDNNITNVNNIIVAISKDRLEAYIYLCPPQDDVVGEEQEILEHTLTVENIYERLEENHITYGIIHENINKLTSGFPFYKEILVAKGEKAQDGRDGFFQYLFDRNFNKTPKVLEDGSVDYHSIKLFESVYKGQEIVRYTKPTLGIDGIDVTGNPVKAGKGKELPEIQGVNITISEDRISYTSMIDGKIEIIDNKIIITNIINIDGDITLTNGDLDCNGDIYINGNIETDMKVKASGSIYVNGYVESAYIYAGRDIILRNGMQGAGKGTIEAGGYISGKFFENTTIKAQKGIKANSIMNCRINTDGMVVVSGRTGIIVGGVTIASQGINSSYIGNDLELKTVLQIGAPKEWYHELFQVVRKIKDVQSNLDKIDTLINRLKSYKDKIQYNKEILNKWVQLENTQKMSNIELKNLYILRMEYIDAIKNTKDAKIIVHKCIYPGSKLIVHGDILHITEEHNNVAIILKENKVQIEKNEK